MNARSLTLAALAWLCALMGMLAFTGAPARAETLHKYESQITEVPAGSGVEVTGPFEAVNAMTVFEGDLYIAEYFDQTKSRSRTDEFGPTTVGTPRFISQLPQSSLSGFTEPYRGIGFGLATDETEMYLGEGNKPTGVTVFGTGMCGTLECTGFQKEWTGTDTPGGSFGEVRDVAVDDSTSPEDWARGDVVVVGDNTNDDSYVVDIFEPEAGGGEKYEGQLTGISPGTPFRFLEHIAVSGFNGDILVQEDSGVVDVFKPVNPAKAGEKGTYSFVGELTPPSGSFHGETHAVTVDNGDGEIFVATTSAVYEFSPEGVFLGEFTGEETPEKTWSYLTHFPRSVAVDPASHRVFVGVYNNEVGSLAAIDLFGPAVVIPSVTIGAVSSVEVDPATHLWGAGLTGTVSPDGGPATCWFMYGTSKTLGERQPCAGAGEGGGNPIPSGGGSAEAPVSVHGSLSGLAPDTTYYYRLQAENANGLQTGTEAQDRSFRTPGPGLRGESVSEVSSSSARLHATIDLDSERTSYRFEYDTRAYTQGESSHGTSAPLTNGPVGAGTEGVEVDQHVLGLTADTEYHYRVVASSEISLGRVEEFDGEDETFVTQRAGGPLVLGDGRMWEQVSPVDKRGALIFPIGEQGPSQASVGGGAFTYTMTASPELEPQGYASSAQLLASRGADGGWSDVVVAMPHGAPTGVGAGTGGEYRFFSEDLSTAIVEPFGAFSQPESDIKGKFVRESSPEATERTPYSRSDATCVVEPMTCYTPLLTTAPGSDDVLSGAEFGGDPSTTLVGEANFVDATPDASHIVLRSRVSLTSPGVPRGGLYEWSARSLGSERLQLVSVLPVSEGGAPAEGVVLGGTNPSQYLVTRHAISNDGSRIVFSATEKHQLYLRDTVRGETIRLDVPVDGSGATAADAVFQIASTNGSNVFFTDAQPLTKDAGRGTEEGDLYECEIQELVEAGGSKLECVLSDLTPVPSAGMPGGGEAARVQGAVLGASEDGGYVYFVADGVQAERASPGDCEEGREPADATCNLYVRHDDRTTFIATLSGDDAPDWSVALPDMTARVSPDGEWLAFMSDQSLTGYDNLDAVSDRPDEEVYLYNAVTGKLVCASCDPTGARPVGVEYKRLDGGLVGGDREWPEGQWLASNIPSWTPYSLLDSTYQSRYLSNEGRLFYNSSDALVPQDINGNEDVYEYEPPGVGSCTPTTATFSSRSDGCVGLISSGVAHGESAFLDASESGGDVFFLTSEKLVPQDTDSSLDVYDAHECTTAAPCPSAPAAQPAECVSAASCRAAPLSQPSIYGAPSSATFSGQGNTTPRPPAVTKPAVKPKSLTRAQKLANALKACRREAKSKRPGCEKGARKRYGPIKRKKK